MSTPQYSFQLGILPERKIDRRALAASYGFVVLVTFLLVNLGLVFPDRLQLKAYRVTELIPLPAMKPEHAPVVKVKLGGKQAGEDEFNEANGITTNQ